MWRYADDDQPQAAQVRSREQRADAWKLVWLDWRYDDCGNCIGALVKDQMFALESGETPEHLIERVHQRFGAAVAHWMMMCPTDQRL
jgi:hypothetical protein